MKILYKYIILGLMLIFVNSINASIILNWSATSGETKTIYAISGSYTIDWGDGNQSQESSHTYNSAGNYEVSISGNVTELDLRGDAGNPTGITKFYLSDNDNSLNILKIWGNTNLTSIDVSKALSLSELNTTACPIETLDLSNNATLISLDVKLCNSLSAIKSPYSFSSLKMIDVNGSAIDACSLNALYKALPSLSGTIYAAGCTGDSSSDPTIATSKGWTFSNGGTGNGSAICKVELTEPTNVSSSMKSSSEHSVVWDNVENAELYSVKVIKTDGDECDAVYYHTTSNSVLVSDIDDVKNYQYYVYSTKDNDFAKSGPFNFSETSDLDTDNLYTQLYVYTQDKNIYIVGCEIGELVTLYNVNGAVVSNSVTSSNKEIITVVIKNDYLLKVGKNTFKVKVF